VDPRGGWFQFGLLSLGSYLEFDAHPPPTTLNTSQNLPLSCEVASLDQAPSFSSVETPGVNPFLLFHHHMSGDPLLPFARPPSSLATRPTTPSLANPQPESPISFASPEPCLRASSPTTVARQPNRVAKPPRKHLCTELGCGYSCAFPKDLRKHAVTHRAPTIECPNRDNGCLEKFGRRDNCSRHVKGWCKYRLRPPGS
jgi:hypothetical protein